MNDINLHWLRVSLTKLREAKRFLDQANYSKACINSIAIAIVDIEFTISEIVDNPEPPSAA